MFPLHYSDFYKLWQIRTKDNIEAEIQSVEQVIKLRNFLEKS